MATDSAHGPRDLKDLFNEEQRDVNDWFELSYASFLVIPRVILQDMPEEWQHKFVALLDELDARYPNQPEVGTRVQVTDLDGNLIKTPADIINYRRPNKKWLKQIRGDSDDE
jgi:hypothetical protein